MKRLILIAIVVVAAIISGLYYGGVILNNATYLTSSSDSLVFGKAGGVQSIFINTDARIWSVKKRPERMRVEQNGDSLIIDCGYMDSKMTSNDTLYIKASDMMLRIPVKQYGKATYLRFTPDTLLIPQKGGTATAHLETDGEKISGLFDKNADARIDGDVVTLTLGPNTNYYELLSYIIVRSDQLESRLYYRQPGTGRRNVVKSSEAKPCPECGGLGKLLTGYNLSSGEKTYEKCHACNGTGHAK
ncbi:MAG: hypothetical protein Q4F34_01115 [Prevotellaceae bacterium]|nr:hypothetical protein [Prevotellaceae bacterium]